MSTPPWENSTIVDAAVDASCRVRDENPDDIRTELAKIPTGRLHDLVLVLAAMVDVDEPLSALRRWQQPGFLGARWRIVTAEPVTPGRCKRGHLLTPENSYSNGRYESDPGRLRVRCRTCTKQKRGRAA